MNLIIHAYNHETVINMKIHASNLCLSEITKIVAPLPRTITVSRL